MSTIASGAARALADALTVPLPLAIILALLITLTCVTTAGYHRIRQRGRRPPVVQIEYGVTAQQDGEDHRALDARLLSYLGADGDGSYVIAPGAGGSAAPSVPAEALESSAALFHLAVAKEPAYRVDVT